MSGLLDRFRHKGGEDNLATFLVLGLGNPGPEYAETPHNAGFLAADVLADQLGCRYWKREGGAQVCVCEVVVPAPAGVLEGGEPGDGAAAPTKVRVVIAKPQDYMNRSGSAAKNLSTAYKVAPDHVIVIHDDLDLPRDDVRCKSGGGHGGHNGLRSLHEKLGTDGYLRVRVGVGRPPGQMDAAKYVLQPWKKDALEGLKISAATAADATFHIVRHGILSAMNQYN